MLQLKPFDALMPHIEDRIAELKNTRTLLESHDSQGVVPARDLVVAASRKRSLTKRIRTRPKEIS